MIDNEQIDKAEIFFDQFNELHKSFNQFWLDEILFQWEWWLSVVFVIGPWIFWIKYRKKESTHRLLYAGTIAIIATTCLDYIGEAFGLWYYAGKIFPTFPAWAPFHFCMMPVAIMFLIQVKPHFAPWKKAIVFGLLTSFLGEPIFVWLGFYVLTGWRYIYSVPIYIILYLFCDYMARRKSFEPVSDGSGES